MDTVSVLGAISEAFGRTLEAADSVEGGRRLGEGLARLFPSDQWWIIVYRDAETPVLFDYYDSGTRGDRYSDGPYLLCPFYNAVQRGLRTGCHRCADLASVNPSQFARYASYYQEPLGPLDEIGLFLPLAEDTTALLSLARRREDRGFIARDIETFDAIAPLALPVMRGLWRASGFASEADSHRRGARHSDAMRAFIRFGADVLTERELEICRLLIRGFAAKEVAHVLSITEGTARNHMKQIYTKMGVGSQAALCGALIDELLNAPLDHAAAG